MRQFFALIAYLISLASPLQAGPGDYGSVRLINGWQMADGTHQAALVFDLEPGWKTYWRSPGPNGIPPQFDWLGSRNLAGVAISWPMPHLVGPEGAQALGYTGQFVLPIRFKPEGEGPISIALYLEFGVCSDICIPASLSLLARLDSAQSEGRALIETALGRVPRAGRAADYSNYTCQILPSSRGYDVATELRLAQADSEAIIAIEYDDRQSWVEPGEHRLNGAEMRATGVIRFMSPGGMVERDRLRVTVLANGGGFELSGCPSG